MSELEDALAEAKTRLAIFKQAAEAEQVMIFLEANRHEEFTLDALDIELSAANGWAPPPFQEYANEAARNLLPQILEEIRLLAHNDLVAARKLLP